MILNAVSDVCSMIAVSLLGSERDSEVGSATMAPPEAAELLSGDRAALAPLVKLVR